MKLSKFNIIEKIDNKYLVFNTLYGSLVLIKQIDYCDFIKANANNINYATWVKEMLIVEDDIDEYQNKLSSIKKENKQILTIFTTTACNARCEYCFEQGITPLFITKDLATDIANKIIQNISVPNLHITWFGGEPLLNTKAIDVITNIVKPYCLANNICYTSSIITNGSLINDEIILKMKNVWGIKAIQISLDGIDEDYNSIKKYVDKKTFNNVIENIKKLVEANLNVNIRVNFDKNNFKKSLKVIDYFNQNSLTSDKVKIYYAPISQSNYSITSKELCDMYSQIFDKLIKYNYIKDINYFQLRFSNGHCQADSKLSYAIFPNGYISKCNRERPNNSKYSIFDKGYLDSLNKDWEQRTSNSLFICKDCKLLPQCSYGCKINDFSNLRKNHCDRCFMYKDAIPSIMQALAKVYNI